MGFIVLAIGLVLCVEGLVIALAPSRLEDLVRFIADMGQQTRRIVGLSALAAGIVLIYLGRGWLGI